MNGEVESFFLAADVGEAGGGCFPAGQLLKHRLAFGQRVRPGRRQIQHLAAPAVGGAQQHRAQAVAND